MDVILSNFSIVVLAQAHNPTILNPDFLKNNDIVSPDFKTKNVICTPPVAQVVYEEGISIVAEFERLQFIDTITERIPESSPIPDIAARYIKILPHVRYTACGINFAGHFPFKDKETARSFISEKFIKPGPWLPQKENTDIGVTFTYSIGNTKKTVSLKPGEIQGPDGAMFPGILVNANYHLDITEGDLESMKSFIFGWQTCSGHLKEFVEVIFSKR